jgi:hypothetical protein
VLNIQCLAQLVKLMVARGLTLTRKLGNLLETETTSNANLMDALIA